MSSYKKLDGNNGFKNFKVNGSGTEQDPYIPVMSVVMAPSSDSTTGWGDPLSDSSVPSEKLVKETIDGQEVVSGSFNTSDGVLTLSKSNGAINISLDGRYLTTVTSVDADFVTISNLETDNFKAGVIITEAEGIEANDNDFCIPTSAAVKNYVDSSSPADKHVTSVAFNSTTGELRLDFNDGSFISASIDGRYIKSLIEDTSPQLGGGLDLNSNDILGTGNISINGEIEANTVISSLRGAVEFKAKALEALAIGDPVYISSYDITGNTPEVGFAVASLADKIPAFGVAKESVAANSPVNIVTFGSLSNLNTSAFNPGDTLYVGKYGGLTNTKPGGETTKIQNIGRVIKSHASSGIIKVGGAGRTNDIPNLNDKNVFIGTWQGVPESRQLTADDITGLPDGRTTNYYNSSTVDFDVSQTIYKVVWDTLVLNDGVQKSSDTVFNLTETGYYKVSYCINVRNRTYSNRVEWRVRPYLNSGYLDQGESYLYTRSSAYGWAGTLSSTFIFYAVAYPFLPAFFSVDLDVRKISISYGDDLSGLSVLPGGTITINRVK